MRDRYEGRRPRRPCPPRLSVLAEAARQLARLRVEAEDRRSRGVVECSYCGRETPAGPRCRACGHDPAEVPF